METVTDMEIHALSNTLFQPLVISNSFHLFVKRCQSTYISHWLYRNNRKK